MEMPKRANPGPVVSKASFFSPISLLIFLVLLFFFATMKGVDIHPVNYFFVCAGFFSFNLLLAYLVDHMSTNIAFLICSVVSVVLVVSYMRLVVGMKIAFLWVGLLQLVYFILFLYAFLLPGYTGLVITVFCIITLFLMMQFTGRIKWDQQKSIFSTQQQPSLETREA